MLRESADELSIADATGQAHTFATDDIEDMQPASTSVMPDQLLSGMTAQQAADLLAFLSAQRKIGELQHKHARIARANGPIDIDGKRNELDWESAAPVGDFVFTWWNEGDGERQQTDARMLWTTVTCTCRLTVATKTSRQLAPSETARSSETIASRSLRRPSSIILRVIDIEMNALGTQLEQYRPDGSSSNTSWDPEGIRVAVSIDGTLNDASDIDRGWTLEVAIPFQLFRHVMPAGDRPRVTVGD